MSGRTAKIRFSSETRNPKPETRNRPAAPVFAAVLPAFGLRAFQRAGARDLLLGGIAAAGKNDLPAIAGISRQAELSEKAEV